MLFVVQHNINNPEKFWAAAQESLPNLPEGIKIHSVMPNNDMTKASCLWQANDLDHITNYLEGKTAAYSKNEYMIVNEAHAMGLPE